MSTNGKRMENLPVLHIPFPRGVTAVHQIEITSNCNLRCKYCTSPSIVKGEYPNRRALDMPHATYVRALEWVKHYVTAGTQVELNLAGIGESTMHPEFIDYLRLAREAVGDAAILTLATNGLIAGDDFVRKMVPYRPQIWVSLHRPEKAGPALVTYRKHGLAVGISTDPATYPNDWAGQVDWPTQERGARIPCQWLREGKLFVLADGRFSACCLDAQGIGILGHVDDPIGSIRTQPYSLCATCYQEIHVRGYEQRPGTSAGVSLPVVP